MPSHQLGDASKSDDCGSKTEHRGRPSQERSVEILERFEGGIGAEEEEGCGEGADTSHCCEWW